MAARWPILVGAVAISGGIAWFGCKSNDKPAGKIAPEGSGALTPAPDSGSSTQRSAKIDVAPLERPQHVATPEEVAPANAAFEAQSRDAAWASGTEADIKAKLKFLKGATLEHVECRQDQCLLSMIGSDADLMISISEIESQGGLRDFADHILLTGPEQKDGTTKIKIYASFDRRDKR
ncbi:hypothetical protein BH11MYX3_BH11MYX3_14550 [soil metagenome]